MFEPRPPINVALIVAGGSGTRAGGVVPKQYRLLGGMPVLRRTALSFLSHPQIYRVRVVVRREDLDLYERAVAGLDLDEQVLGGESRRESVRRGLHGIMSEVNAEDGPVSVLIHDAARPFLPAAIIDRLLRALDEASAAVPVLPVVDTLARGDKALGDTVPREGLVRVQTPQAFRLEAILDAHQRWAGGEATDDAQVARAAGFRVATVEGDPALEKLTYEADFAHAEAMLAAKLQPRTGLGFDVHAFGPGEHLWLGGVRIAHDRGLLGHSDADVALHALTDALLGALAAGDLGDHFPPSDPEWRGAPSSLFLEHARGLIEKAGGWIVHCDLTLICEAPRIGPHRAAMRARIADRLRLPQSSISVKATTTERLGFTGRGEGIAAQAIATVLVPESA